METTTLIICLIAILLDIFVCIDQYKKQEYKVAMFYAFAMGAAFLWFLVLLID